MDFSKFPLLLCGHSHVYAIAGYEETEKAFKTTNDFEVGRVSHAPGVFILHSVWPRPEDYWEQVCNVAQAPGDLSICVSYRGNDHLGGFFLQLAEPFDFYLPELPQWGVDPDVRLLPQRMIEASFAVHYDSFRSAVRSMVKTGKRVFLLGTPPPKNDDGFLRANLLNEPFFIGKCAIFGVSPGEVPFSPISLRIKLWAVLQILTKRVAEEEGAEFVAAPETTLNLDGSLRREFWADDCTHANTSYGKAVLRAVYEKLHEKGRP